MSANAHTPRTFETPAALVAAGYAPTADLDTLDREVEFPGDYGDWAEKVLLSENYKILEEVCGDMRLLPRGILSPTQLDDGSVLIAGLVDGDDRVWDGRTNTWTTPSEKIDVAGSTLILEDDEIAFVARALREGADEVWFRPYIPKAFVSAVVAAPPPPFDRQGKKAKQPKEAPVNQEIPPGSPIIAVVDPIDEDAVLEMLAITQGPHVFRRHDGQWFEDPEWVPVLKSVRPPKIVKLNEAQVASVTNQVDRSTNDQDWEPFDADTREQYQIFTASAGPVYKSQYLQNLQRESDEQALFALVALAGREITPSDVAATERLKRYWTVGKGAAKIRWGTPGSWTRCYKHIVKYMRPDIAKGYCTNLSQRLGGPGIATHVTSAADPVTAANPSGVNAYDYGSSFEEATGGVERDYHGRFAPEFGGRSERRRRRQKSLDRRRKERKDKESKKSRSSAEAINKRNAAAYKRKVKEAQALELAKIDHAIAAIESSKAMDDPKRRDAVRLMVADYRVKRAERVLAFADTPLRRTRALAAHSRAVAARRRLRASIRKAAQTKAAAQRTPRQRVQDNFDSDEDNLSEAIDAFYRYYKRYPNDQEMAQLRANNK